MTPSITFATEEPLWRRLFPNHEWALVAMLFVETAVFAFIGDNFFTGANGFEIIRLSVEVGLLAMALTPVIITGGIDLTVGSMMGLSAIVCGWLWRDAGLPIWASAALTLALGLLGGGLHALLIARFNLPPLIVTLGTFSLFRGLAEGMTGGVDNYTGFPQEFLFLGQGYLFGILPPQALALIAVAVFYFLLLHRTIIGRSLYAIGFSAEGARYAGVPVARRPRLSALGTGREPGGGHLHSAPGSSEIGRRRRVRVDGDYGGRARRDLDLRRARHALGHGARAVRHRDFTKRIETGRAACRIGRHSDRGVARHHNLR